jgi:uncharacterized protein YoxC
MVKNKNRDMAKKVIVGAGIVAGAALAAYLLTTQKERAEAAKKIKSWMTDMQNEIAERVKKVQDLTEEKYNQIVDDVISKYESLKEVSAAELSSFSDEMKTHWKNVSDAAKK